MNSSASAAAMASKIDYACQHIRCWWWSGKRCNSCATTAAAAVAAAAAAAAVAAAAAGLSCVQVGSSPPMLWALGMQSCLAFGLTSITAWRFSAAAEVSWQLPGRKYVSWCMDSSVLGSVDQHHRMEAQRSGRGELAAAGHTVCCVVHGGWCALQF
jgi:hypothetical protein